MKHFFSTFLAALLALVVFVAGVFLLFTGILAVVSATADQAPGIERGSYLVLDLSVNISDSPDELSGTQMLGQLLGMSDRASSIQLRTVLRVLDAAARDDRIAGVYLSGQISPLGYGSGYGTLREVREALETFRETSGKPVLAYLGLAVARDYYVSSAADEVIMDPYGALLLPGLSTRPLFISGALDRFGIGVQVTRVGEFKAAVEPFLREDMSPENRLQTQVLLDDLWEDLRSHIARSRNLSSESVQALVDRDALFRADEAQTAGLVDRVAYLDEMLDELKERTGQPARERTFKQIDFESYARTLRDAGEGRRAPRIAVVYAEGALVDGEGMGGDIGGARLSRELRRMRMDDDIRAVVLRVNSPGGSAAASELIQREVRLMRQVKPVVVSMGTMAASGGYWISAYADRIFAQPNTITGSIGVFGAFLNVQELANRHGITWDVVKTGRFADALTITRPKTPEEMAIVQRHVDWIYEEFIQKVSEGRNLTEASVRSLAEGRVWSGMAALELGLVDAFGGLQDAIRHAADLAEVKERFRIVEYPRRLDFWEAISRLLGSREEKTAGDVFSLVSLEMEEGVKFLRQFNDRRGLYARLPFDLNVQ